MIDCSDSECCSHPVCSEHIMCLSSNEPVDVLLRKQPPSVTASFFQRVKFLIEDNSVQSYAHKDEYAERWVNSSLWTFLLIMLLLQDKMKTRIEFRKRRKSRWNFFFLDEPKQEKKFCFAWTQLHLNFSSRSSSSLFLLRSDSIYIHTSGESISESSNDFEFEWIRWKDSFN